MSKVFFGGVPTGGDVRKLVQRLGVPRPGDEFTHEQVEQVCGFARKTSRYRSVTQAWRDQLRRDHNVDLDSLPGVGFRALLPEERIAAGTKGVTFGIRKQLRGIKRADAVITDDQSLQRKQDVLRRYGVAMVQHAGTMKKELLELPKPDEQMPRIAPQQGR